MTTFLYKFLGIAILVCFSHTANAQSKNPFTALNQNTDQPIEIAANTFKIIQKEEKGIGSGGVDVRQGNLRLRSDTLEVTYLQDNSQSTNAIGGGNFKDVIATGNVFATDGDSSAKGDMMHYDVQSGLLKLTGNVYLSNGNNIFSGSQLIVDINSGEAELQSNGTTPVRMLVDPNSQSPQ